MITDRIIKEQYISDILKRDSEYIYETQAEAVRDNFSNKRAMMLADYLESKPLTLGHGLNIVCEFNILSYLRFLDINEMKNRRLRSKDGIALYNRVIWGRLYNETIRDLRYGLTQDIKNEYKQKLEQSNFK